MYIQIVKNIMKANSLSMADMARLAGTSRAAVTKWFRKGVHSDWINVESDTIRQLAEQLHLPPHLFLQKRPRLDNAASRFLWDSLYPDMESFCLALSHGRPPALARLVQICGFAKARRILGKRAITAFSTYTHHIKPIRRRELELIWPLYHSTT